MQESVFSAHFSIKSRNFMVHNRVFILFLKRWIDIGNCRVILKEQKISQSGRLCEIRTISATNGMAERTGYVIKIEYTSGFCGKCATRSRFSGADTHPCSAEQGNQVKFLDMFRGR